MSIHYFGVFRRCCTLCYTFSILCVCYAINFLFLVRFCFCLFFFFFFQAEDGIRDLVRSRGLGDVYKRQGSNVPNRADMGFVRPGHQPWPGRVDPCKKIEILSSRCFHAEMSSGDVPTSPTEPYPCLLYTSDAADERSSVDLGGRRIIKKKNRRDTSRR